jgi:hypothetical protein
MGESKPIKIFQTKAPIFRKEIKPETLTDVGETAFSEESNNENNLNGEGGWKTFSLIDKANGEVIGSIKYDYPNEQLSDRVLKVRFSGVGEKYLGQNLAMALYEKLLDKARSNNLDGVGSDSVVQGGAMVLWKKLADKGYKLTIDPSQQEKWKNFLDTYNEGKIFKEMFSVNKNSSVFKILFKEQNNK